MTKLNKIIALSLCVLCGVVNAGKRLREDNVQCPSIDSDMSSDTECQQPAIRQNTGAAIEDDVVTINSAALETLRLCRQDPNFSIHGLKPDQWNDIEILDGVMQGKSNIRIGCHGIFSNICLSSLSRHLRLELFTGTLQILRKLDQEVDMLGLEIDDFNEGLVIDIGRQYTSRFPVGKLEINIQCNKDVELIPEVAGQVLIQANAIRLKANEKVNLAFHDLENLNPHQKQQMFLDTHKLATKLAQLMQETPAPMDIT